MATLVEAKAPADLDLVRELFVEYARGVGEPCCFTGFERELTQLRELYPVLILVTEAEAAAGCVGVRALDGTTAEMKRLYVRPAYRGRGTGRALAEAAIAAARQLRCERLVLDSLPKMRPALALYAELGFREIDPYLPEPTPGARCFELRL